MKPALDQASKTLLAERCHYSLEELCAAYGKSRRQMRRYFRVRFGCTPQAFLREERLQAAYRLLRSSVSVKEVAYALGFRQESQFSRDFRARFGVVPSAVLGLPQLAGPEIDDSEEQRPAPYWEPVAARLALLSPGRSALAEFS